MGESFPAGSRASPRPPPRECRFISTTPNPTWTSWLGRSGADELGEVDMDCCGRMVSRRDWLWRTLVTSAASPVASFAAQRGAGAPAAGGAPPPPAQAVAPGDNRGDVHRPPAP